MEEVHFGRTILLHGGADVVSLHLCCFHVVCELGRRSPLDRLELLRWSIGSYDGGRNVMSGDCILLNLPRGVGMLGRASRRLRQLLPSLFWPLAVRPRELLLGLRACDFLHCPPDLRRERGVATCGPGWTNDIEDNFNILQRLSKVSGSGSLHFQTARWGFKACYLHFLHHSLRLLARGGVHRRVHDAKLMVHLPPRNLRCRFLSRPPPWSPTSAVWRCCSCSFRA